MRFSNRIAAVVAVAVLVVAAVGGVAFASGGDDDEELTGETREKAIAAALAFTGGQGTVVETEVGDDGAAYGVEIRFEDGREFEINLNDKFEVINSELDDDELGEEDD